MFELFVAKRYLRAKRKQVMISVTTVIAVLGIAAGVMAMIIALAINNGYVGTLERSFLGITAHVFVLDESGNGIPDWRQLAEKLRSMPDVVGVSPSLYDFGFLRGTKNSSGVQVRGIQVSSDAGALPGALRKLKEGSVADLRGEDNLPGIILGARLAETIGGVVGKQVGLLLPNGEITPFGPRATNTQLRVVGIFESGVYDVDSTWAFMQLGDVQRIFSYGDIVNSIDMNVDDIYRAPQIAQQVQAMLPPGLSTTTWQELNRPILEALSMERRVMVIVIGLIQLVAAGIILVALVMIVMEKHRDIAVLMSMGARISQIRRIFILEGAMIGGAGTVIGLILGFTLSYLANRYQWVRLNEQVYSIGYVPVEGQWTDGLWVAAGAILVSLLATLYPARSATQISPVDAMRYE